MKKKVFQGHPYNALWPSTCSYYEKTFFLRFCRYYTHFCREMPRKSDIKLKSYIDQQKIKF